MSAAGRNKPGRERIPFDDYPTPAYCVYRLLDVLKEERAIRFEPTPNGDATRRPRWLEPCAGQGNLITAVDLWHAARDLARPAWTAVDIQEKHRADLAPLAQLVEIGDFAKPDGPPLARATALPYDVVITNPPYSLAEQVLTRALQFGNVVVLLLRLPFLASAARQDLLARKMPNVYVLPDRPKFAHDATDNADYGWMLWRAASSNIAGRARRLALTPYETRCGGVSRRRGRGAPPEVET